MKLFELVAVGLDKADITMAHATRLQTALDLQQREIKAQRARIAELETMSAEIVALRSELTEYRMLVEEIQNIEVSVVQRH